jgi:hypothetical protein
LEAKLTRRVEAGLTGKPWDEWGASELSLAPVGTSPVSRPLRLVHGRPLRFWETARGRLWRAIPGPTPPLLEWGGPSSLDPVLGFPPQKRGPYADLWRYWQWVLGKANPRVGRLALGERALVSLPLDWAHTAASQPSFLHRALRGAPPTFVPLKRRRLFTQPLGDSEVG